MIYNIAPQEEMLRIAIDNAVAADKYETYLSFQET